MLAVTAEKPIPGVETGGEVGSLPRAVGPRKRLDGRCAMCLDDEETELWVCEVCSIGICINCLWECRDCLSAVCAPHSPDHVCPGESASVPCLEGFQDGGGFSERPSGAGISTQVEAESVVRLKARAGIDKEFRKAKQGVGTKSKTPTGERA